ncbi:MAG: GGDEF domain-containing protein [Candidatus Latescibacteria bacterium]|jgi:diguanylate cyclase|nr:GGDEF domain-containing protein [Candidatus Latescibacterota bacterium]
MIDQDFLKLGEAGVQRSFEDGEVVFRKGDASGEMYLIVSGTVELKFEGDRDDKTIGSGEYFGELSFVVGRNFRSASAVAGSKLEMIALDQTAFDRLMVSQTDLLFKLVRRSCAYLLESEQELIEDLRQRNTQLQDTLNNLRHTKAELDFQEIQAQTDEMTGLYNRRALNTQLDKYMKRHHLSGRQLGVLMVDLDGFKLINDTYGHHVGDEVLILVAEILKKAVREDDFPCRQGGDEFVLLLPDTTDRNGRAIAERIRKAIEALPPIPADAKHKASGSLGGTLLRENETRESFLERADRYLYQAKDSGRNLVVWEGGTL